MVDIEKNCAAPCSCQADRRRERLFKNSKITPGFKSKTFDNFCSQNRPVVIKKMLQSAWHYAANFKLLQENNWLVLLGEPGCGKTHLSCAVANQLLEKGISVLYFPHVQGMNELKDTLRAGEESLEARLWDMRKVHLLVWDDLFKARREPTPWTVEIVFDILNYRYLNMLPTIISSELTPQNLLSIDAAIGSRIMERGRGHTMVVSGIEYNYRIL
ncbi:DNA replication protein DnaC [Sporotomaculum syntrophicum]|uniref:DNA replication protein DnaC n=1 Tax=Sporotomaculum syntrophicum TaxID=182264 RepID=A0A9D2WSK3_9FIRM|nr:DNA replication protein DnaC [Sporotomaculum syntrophicum]